MSVPIEDLTVDELMRRMSETYAKHEHKYSSDMSIRKQLDTITLIYNLAHAFKRELAAAGTQQEGEN